MSSFNKVILMGNLTRDPELRATPGGTQVTEVSLAINDVYTDGKGQRQERVTFVEVTFWAKMAETICRWKKKGDPLLVEGRLQMDQWNDKETGQKRSKLRVVANGFTFVGRGGGEGGGGGGGGGGSGRQGSRPSGGGKPQSRGNSGGDDAPPPSDEDYATSMPPSGDGDPPF